MHLSSWNQKKSHLNSLSYVVLAIAMLTGQLGILLGLFGITHFMDLAMTVPAFQFEPVAGFLISIYVLLRAFFIKVTPRLSATSWLLAFITFVEFIFGGVYFDFIPLFFAALCFFIVLEFRMFRGSASSFTAKLAGSLSFLLILFVVLNVCLVAMEETSPFKTNISMVQLLTTSVLVVLGSFAWPQGKRRVLMAVLSFLLMSNMITNDMMRSINSGHFYIGSILILISLLSIIGTGYKKNPLPVDSNVASDPH